MKNAATPTAGRSAVLSYFSLFTSLSTLLCCALPSLLVLFGLGASVASMLSFLPWLVALSRHKVLTFSISGALIACSFLNTYYILPRMTKRECSPDDPDRMRGSKQTQQDPAVGVGSDLRGRLLRRIRNGTNFV